MACELHSDRDFVKTGRVPAVIGFVFGSDWSLRGDNQYLKGARSRPRVSRAQLLGRTSRGNRLLSGPLSQRRDAVKRLYAENSS